MLCASRATAIDFSGSVIIFVSITLQLAHPKERCSKPPFMVSDRMSAIRAEHRGQRGCSIVARVGGFGSLNELRYRAICTRVEEILPKGLPVLGIFSSSLNW
jgi:hypothetical protein